MEGEKRMVRPGKLTQVGEEKDARWYSEKFRANSHKPEHFTQFKYYFLFASLVTRLAPGGDESVLDIGCGPGHMAGLLRDVGVSRYCGFDFSEARIEYARATYPECEFHVADIFKTDLFQTVDYDTVICTEVLEHIERDREVLSKIKSGTRFLGSVPSYDSAAHVRYFTNKSDVEARYRDHFAKLRIDSLPHGVKGERIYIIDGIIM
jgi:SAM-dependent methyltransferase